MLRTLCVAAGLTLAAAPALAGEVFAGLYSHDIVDHISLGNTERGQQIVLGVRTAPVEIPWLFDPRVHLLVGLNTARETDYIAAGFSWRFRLGGDRFYFEPGIGGALHTGNVGLPSPYDAGLTFDQALYRYNRWQTKLDLGSRVLFEPELTLGMKATDRMSVELSWIHLSHAKLAGPQNPGMGDIGVRAVYRYGVDR